MSSAQIIFAAHHQSPWAQHFGDGLKRHGWTVEYNTGRRADLLVLWGVRNQGAIRAQKAAGGEVCVLERGYLGDRFKWTSVSFGGGLNGRGIYKGPDDPVRFDRHFGGLMRPWRDNEDGYGLILGQVVGDMSVDGVDVARHWAKWADDLKALGIDPAFRGHPLASRTSCGFAGAMAQGQSLDEALAAARLAVTWNSNAAVEAVLAGVPAITMDKGAMAWEVTGHDIMAPPPKPDRTVWAAALAWKQWTLDEMSSGYCWEMAGLQCG